MMPTDASPIVAVRMNRNENYTVPARLLKTFSDGTALVRFAAGNLRIVHEDFLETATAADEREYLTMLV